MFNIFRSSNIVDVDVSEFFYFSLGGYSDIYSIPVDLRVVLERCLAEDPSPEILETYMAEVRHVLFKLLKGLQNRQERWQLATKGPRHSSRPSSGLQQ